MEAPQLETVETSKLDHVTGGSWLQMLSGGKLNIASLLGGANPNGGAFGVDKNGQGRSLSAGIASLFNLGGDSTFKAVEGQDPPGNGG